MKLGFLSRMFEGALSIEKTYNQCDKALSDLQAYNEKRKAADFQISTEEKAELDEVVNTAITNATRIVDKEGERNWPGVFREMHTNLAKLYLELDEHDKVRAECERLQDYGETGRLEADEVLESLKEKEDA
ncbi:hypothetical protein F4X88_18150 [Candidatus Poribacteria bacterium]|nr:hypothetical protein [Candidatus Poribacteria bacterium]MDE0688087.1 hypothetical protein [Candidatus Poribacteria bacterium]MXV85479.1 hypothetical protein [Candidatus Poribacteria bacterium]MYA58210.1 hypothetical protein [Candidatus Poribacteria bacterium]